MKPEFSEVLLPTTDKDSINRSQVMFSSPAVSGPSRNYGPLFKVLGVLAVAFGFFALTVLTVGIVVRYESKLAGYEARITVLEDELGLFFEQFESVGGGVDRVQDIMMEEEEEEDDPMTDDEDNSSSYEEEEVESLLFPILRTRAEEGREDEDQINKLIFGELKTKESEPLSRHRRQIPTSQGPSIGSNVERSKSGVPILEGSYGSPSAESGSRNSFQLQGPHPTESEGLRIYESLITTGGRGEPKAADFSESDGSNVQAYHRSSAAWSERQAGRSGRLEVKSGDNLSDGGSLRSGSGAGASASSRRGTSYGTGRYAPEPSVLVRTSRVPSTSEYIYPQRGSQQARSSYQYPPLKKIGQGDGEVIARVHQESIDSESEPDLVTAEATHGETASAHAESRTYKGGWTRRTDQTRGHDDQFGRKRIGRPHSRRETESQSDEVSYVKAEAWAEGPKTYAAHYVADPSNYTLAHRHYEGNGRLKNADGIFSAWKASDWMSGNAGSKEAFALSSNGVLTVKKEGLYYIYAQIHYLDDHDINGFLVQHNSVPFLQCTRMTETTSSSKSNTCFTAGVNFLKENDRIMVRDVETNRFSIIKPEKSFFGLMRIGDSGGR